MPSTEEVNLVNLKNYYDCRRTRLGHHFVILYSFLILLMNIFLVFYVSWKFSFLFSLFGMLNINLLFMEHSYTTSRYGCIYI